MLNVSQNFHNAINTFPRTIAATVEFDMVDVAAQGNCTPTANSSANIGSVNQVTDGLTQIKKYMSEETNYLLLDGSFYTPPKPSDVTFDSVGWWSSAISDSNGNFSSPYPQVTLTLSKPFNSNGLTFVFSPMTNDYCNSIQVVTTDNNNNQTTYNINPNSGIYFWNQQMTNIVSVVITFYSTNNPYRRVHLNEVLFGEMFQWTGQNIFEMDLVEELDPLGNTATPKELSVSVANNLNAFNVYLNNLQKKQVLKSYLSLIYPTGTSEMIPMGIFYLYNWRNDDNYLSSTLYARDLLDVMDGTTFYAYNYTGTPISLYNLAIAIIQDFNKQSSLNVNFSIDSALQNIYTSGVLPIMTHHDALMRVAQAGMAVLYMDRYNQLHIKQSKSMQPLNPMAYTEELTLSMQETYPKISTQDPYNYFTANVYSNTVADSSSNIYNGNITINGTQSVRVPYNSPASASTCSASITGGTLVSATYYTNAAYLTITGSGNVTINITGNQISSTSIKSSLNNAETQPVNEVDIDNPLITDSAMASNILNWFAAECQNIYLYESGTWMMPHTECGDVIYWDSQYYTAQKQAKIIKQEFNFSGTLSGTLNGKGGA